MPKVVLALVAALILHAAAPAHADDLSLLSYTRLGHAMVFDATRRTAPGFGFGLRAELETFAVDVSFLNLALGVNVVDTGRDLMAGSLLRIQVLRFLTPHRSRSAYAGGGLGWGQVSLERAQTVVSGGSTSWHGSGLQVELTAGYELARMSPIRLFVQADASAPLFAAQSETFAYPQPGAVVSTGHDRRYVPSVVVSMGIGWHRGR
jgi:hypothetical protein